MHPQNVRNDPRHNGTAAHYDPGTYESLRNTDHESDEDEHPGWHSSPRYGRRTHEDDEWWNDEDETDYLDSDHGLGGHQIDLAHHDHRRVGNSAFGFVNGPGWSRLIHNIFEPIGDLEEEFVTQSYRRESNDTSGTHSPSSPADSMYPEPGSSNNTSTTSSGYGSPEDSVLLSVPPQTTADIVVYTAQDHETTFQDTPAANYFTSVPLCLGPNFILGPDFMLGLPHGSIYSESSGDGDA